MRKKKLWLKKPNKTSLIARLAYMPFLLFTALSLAAPSPDSERIQQLQQQLSNPNQENIMVVAHRGCWSAAPENSIQSVLNCIDMGVEVVEIDVQLAADEQLVVFHDATLERMTSGSGKVAEKTLVELQSLRLYERGGEPSFIHQKKIITSHSIPTLEALFSATRGKIMVNLEIKSNKRFSFTQVFNKATELAKNMGVQDQVLWKIPAAGRAYKRPIVGNFSGSSAKDTPSDAILRTLDISDLDYVFPIIWQSDRPFTQQLADFSDYQLAGFEVVVNAHGNWPLNQQQQVPGANRYAYMGIAVHAKWSGGLSDDLALSQPDATWGKLAEMGMKLVMTDRPEQLIRYLENKGLRKVSTAACRPVTPAAPTGCSGSAVQGR